MRTTVKRWGNSAAVRLPAGVLMAAGIGVDEVVDIREDNGQIVITPVRQELSLDDLLAGITPENTHGSVDFGGPVGGEAL